VEIKPLTRRIDAIGRAVDEAEAEIQEIEHVAHLVAFYDGVTGAPLPGQDFLDEAQVMLPAKKSWPVQQ